MRKIFVLASLAISLVFSETNDNVDSILKATTDAWKKRTVYQLLTDRFAKTSGTEGCGNLGNYCGGTF